MHWKLLFNLIYQQPHPLQTKMGSDSLLPRTLRYTFMRALERTDAAPDAGALALNKGEAFGVWER